MGLINQQQYEESRTNWLSIDQTTGNFSTGKELYPAIEGTFMGINCHEYDSQGIHGKKLDIYLYDDKLYQVQIGFDSYLALNCLNMLLNVPDLSIGKGRLMLIASKKDLKDKNYRIWASWNGIRLEWKYTHDELKITNAPDKTTRVKAVVLNMYNKLSETILYTPAPIVAENQNDTYEPPPSDDDTPF